MNTKEVGIREFVTGGYDGYDEHLAWQTKEQAMRNAKYLQDQGFKVIIVQKPNGSWTVYKR